MDKFQDPRLKAQNRANVQQLKLIGQSHQTGLTNSLLKLFEARPELDFKPTPQKRKLPAYQGVAQFVEHFAEPGDSEYAPPVTKGETPIQKKNRIREAKLANGAEKVSRDLESYDATKDPKVDGDPYKTLFVARVSYESTETKLKREFEAYGPIRKIRFVNDNESGKPRGYAFVEFQHTRDMKTAYKQADGRKIDNRRVIVDVERGRTVPNWRPRRLGGGLGSTRTGGDEVNQRHSGREPQVGATVTSEDAGVAFKPRSAVKGEEPLRDRERQGDERGERANRGEVKGRERDRDRDRERDPDRERERDRDRERGPDRERPERTERSERGDRDRRQSDRHDRTSYRDRKEDRGERSRSRDRERDW